MLPRKRTMLGIAVALLLLARYTEQSPSGAPAMSCVDQLPRHPGIREQTSAPPFAIFTSASQVRQGSFLNVTIGSPFGAPVPISGFILQARQVQNPDIIEGMFVGVPSLSLAQIMSCRGSNDTVTHTSPEDKPPLSFQWKAPDNLLGGVSFRATVAQSYSTFWKNVESPIVEVVTRDTQITSTQATTTTKKVALAPPSIMETKVQATTPLPDIVYRGCGDTKLCFGVPTNCVDRADCRAIVAVLVAGDQYTFEMQADSSARYAASGLSDDAKMGDDSAMECVRNDDGRISLHASWTYPKTEPYVSRKESPQNIIRLLESSYIDGKLYCKFVRDSVSVVQGRTFDLVNNKYHLMIAAGISMKDSERVGFHTLGYEATGQPLALAAVVAPTASPKLLIKLHGSLMLVAWMVTASIGILLARYYKQTWVGRQLGGKDIWFAYHRILMVTTWVLTLVAFIIILIEAGGWAPGGGNPHAITGIIAIILCFIQPIGAIFRPHPGTKKRPIFNWLHWLIGNTAHILAIVSFFLSVYLPKAELPVWSVYILAAFVAFHVIIHILLSLSGCASSGRVGEGRAATIPMKEMARSEPSSPQRQLSQPDAPTDAPFSGFRKHVLSIYSSIILLFAVAMICLVALAPISETYNSIAGV